MNSWLTHLRCSVIRATVNVMDSRAIFRMDMGFAKVTRRGTGVCASELTLHH